MRISPLAPTLLCVLLLLGACGGAPSSVPPVQSPGQPPVDDPDTSKYDVTITRTALGIPHINGRDFASLGYGYGYAHAEDNLCVLLDDLLTNRGERSRYFGPDGDHVIFPNGSTASNLDSDFFWKAIANDTAIAPLKTNTDEGARQVTLGFVDGLNRYLSELKAGQHPGRHASCRDEPWALPITADDMYRRYYRLVLLASSSVFVSGIAQAQPPLPGEEPEQASAEAISAALAEDAGPFRFFTEPQLGSNMYAIGKDASATGIPMVFGNPHFPWRGPERLYVSHLTVPGQMDIMGSSLYGVPLVLIGFNEHLAWSHTVSTAFRFGLYELTLVPGDPTAYLYEGEIRRMEAQPVSVEVLTAEGQLETRTRTLYRSHYGPMISLLVSGVDILPWSTSKAYSIRDANAENDRLISHFFRWNTARSFEAFKQVQAQTVAVPWVNTIGSGPESRAYYADVTVVPHVTDAKVQNCSTSAQAQALAQLVPGLPLLDGSRAACEWGSDDDAPAPGIFGSGNLPRLERDDWVGNFNDSYWLTNPAEPLTGFNRIIGNENAVRSLRTRLGILKQLRRLDGSDGEDGTLWTVEQLKRSVLDSHIYSAELGRDDVVATTCALGTVPSNSGPVNAAAACAVLANWDLSNNRDSHGGHVWREFWVNAQGATGFYRTPFSVADPVNTPRDIRADSPQVMAALGDAIKRIESAGVALDARLGDLQRSGVNGEEIEIYGGLGNTEGAFTIAQSARLGVRDNVVTDKYRVIFGNSYMQVVTWEPAGDGFVPVADGFVTYSQSTDPASPHFNDFTRAYADKAWHRFPFTPAQVQAAKVSELRLRE